MPKIWALKGPNLHPLGTRETSVHDEVNLSNVQAREPFRHRSFLSPACARVARR